MTWIASRAYRATVTVALASAIMMCSPGAARAATPTVHGCFGESVSAVAAEWRPFGNFVSGTAQDPTNRPGIGDGVQAVQAGQVDDADFPNTCN